MVHLDPDGRDGVALECFGQVLEAVSKHSTQVPKADHTHVWLEWFPMVLWFT